MDRKIQLSAEREAAYLNVLKPYIKKIEKDILPKVNSSTASKSPAYYGILYKKQVEMAISGDFDALRHVGVLLYDGVHIPKHKQLALSLLKVMAFGSDKLPLGFNPPSAYSYAKLTLKEGNPQKTIDILKQLIDVNFIPAMALMGNMYHYGNGVTQDFSNANKYYKYAQSRGHIYATSLRAKLHFQNKNFIKKIIGLMLYLRFFIRTLLYEFLYAKTDNKWLSYY